MLICANKGLIVKKITPLSFILNKNIKIIRKIKFQHKIIEQEL